MRLTVYADSSLRMLIYLAVKGNDLATIGDVADAYGISRHHLTKVAHPLGVAGYVATARGKGGGLRLDKAADRIRLSEMVRHAEPDMALVPCFEPLCVSCPIVPCCGLRGALNKARQAFMAVLDSYTLADLVTPRDELQELLAITPV